MTVALKRRTAIEREGWFSSRIQKMEKVVEDIRAEFAVDYEYAESVLLTADNELVANEVDVGQFYTAQQQKYPGATRVYIAEV